MSETQPILHTAASVEGPLLVRLGSFGEKPIEVMVPDLVAAAEVCRNFIQDEDLGSSAWLGGEVFTDDESHRCVAVVSYNGRVWEPGGKNPEGHHVAGSKEFLLY